METAPKISIGMAVYNGEKYLEKTLDSLLSQDYRDFELIISDNASADRTFEICQAYAGRDQRIRLFRNATNLGAIANYNRVFRESVGEYFKWAAADDICRPSLLSSCARVLDERPDVVLAYPRTEIIDGDGNHTRFYDDNLNLLQEGPVTRFEEAQERMRMCNAICGLIRSSALAKTRLIGTYVGSDAVLLLELTLHGKFYEIPDHLFCRRLHSASYSAEVTVGGMHEFLAGGSKPTWNPDTWLMLKDYLCLIPGSPLSVWQKARLARLVVHVAIGMRRRLWRELATLPHMIGVKEDRHERSVS